MPKTTGVTGYLNLGGSTLLHAIVVEDGPDTKIVTYAGRSLIDDVDFRVARWFNDRAVHAICAKTGVSYDLGTIQLMSPNGGLSDFTNALNADSGRDSRAFTTDAFAQKMDAKRAAKIIAGLITFYATAQTKAA